MAVADQIAAQFARCLELFRDAGAKDKQKTEFRVLMGLLQTAPFTLRGVGGRVAVNGTPLEGPGFEPLVQRIELHNIGEITILEGPPPAQVFELLQALAAAPGADDVPTRLGYAG